MTKWRSGDLARWGLVAAALTRVPVMIQAQQMRRPTATLTPLAASSAARVGREVRLAVRVVLPSAALHVQANKPCEANLIPTVLTVDPPAILSNR